MPAPQPKPVSHEQLGHLSHRETAGRYLVPPRDPEGAPGHSAGAGVACVSPSYCLCQASCSCLHLEGGKVHLGATIRDRLTVSGRDAHWGFAAMCLPEKAWSCSELACLYAGAQCPPNFKGWWLQPSLWSRGAAAGRYTAPCSTHGDPGAELQAGMGALLARNSVSALLLPRSPCAYSRHSYPITKGSGAKPGPRADPRRQHHNPPRTDSRKPISFWLSALLGMNQAVWSSGSSTGKHSAVFLTYTM